MINLPEAVLNAIEEYGLPEYMLEYFFLLLEKEQENNYPSFKYGTAITQRHVDAYAWCIVVLINAGYELHEPGQGIRVPLYQLKGWDWERLDEFQISPGLTGLTIQTSPECMWRDILEMPVYVRFKWKDRFMHTHILGGTGAGKTVLLEQLISFDLQSDASVIVMDSSGDLLNRLKRSKFIHPDRLVIIDPEDSVLHPLAINIFDVDFDQNDPVMYERKLNNVVEQLNFIFSSVLKSETTGKQDSLVKFCCSLILRIEGATVNTFLELLRKKTWNELGEYRGIIESLPITSQEFFKTAYPPGLRDPNEYRATKAEVHRRFLAFFTSETMSRLFSSPINRLDLAKEMDKGKVILINTDESLLGEDGCKFLGRFFLSQISHATINRMNIPEEKRRPTFFYIDECGDYLKGEDSSISRLLDKARKYRLGVTLAHQRVGHLTADTFSAVRANCAIKIVGAPEDGSLNTLMRDLRVEHIPSNPGRFATYIRGSRLGMHVRSRMGVLDKAGFRTVAELENVIRENRAKYCVGNYKPPEKPKIEQKEVKSDEPSDTPNDDIESFNTL